MDWKQSKPPAVIKHPTMPGVLILVKEDEVLPCPPEEEDQVFALAEEVSPCPHYQKGHCKGIRKACKLSHAAQICWKQKCTRGSACSMRHPRTCNLFFRSARGCFEQNCIYRQMKPVESHPVLLTCQPAIGDDARLVELQEKLIAQEAQMKSLLSSISKLGCKIGNLEASFNSQISALDIKFSAETNIAYDNVQRIQTTVEELKKHKTDKRIATTGEPNPPLKVNEELVTLQSEISELRTEFAEFADLNNTQEKLQKVETKQLSTDKYIETLKQILLPDDSLVPNNHGLYDSLLLRSAFKKNLYALQHSMDSKLRKQKVFIAIVT